MVSRPITRLVGWASALTLAAVLVFGVALADARTLTSAPRARSDRASTSRSDETAASTSCSRATARLRLRPRTGARG